MAGEVAEIKTLIDKDQERLAAEIANMWQAYNSSRSDWIDETKEIRDFVFATDTSQTSNQDLPWKNKTHLPKLCQIRDNLHANYMDAMFPNDDWLRWEGFTEESNSLDKVKAIQAYMSNKLRLFDFEQTISQFVYDYIDYGQPFGTAEYRRVWRQDSDSNTPVVAKEGPVAVRYSPYQIVHNPLASSFNSSVKVVRALRSIGELARDIEERSGDGNWRQDILAKVRKFRQDVTSHKEEDVDLAYGLTMDGFGSYSEYLQSDYVEVLEFQGDLYMSETGELQLNRIVTVVDRMFVVRNEPLRTYSGDSRIFTVGWRDRPGNLYAVGPLNNLVGMQYRIDHLENAKADLWDFAVMPPVKVKGQVEDFDWKPLEVIYLGEDGDVDLLKIETAALSADPQILTLEQKMDEFAGAPKQSIGARTAGEKTAFEVNTLEQNAAKMFSEKTKKFEKQFLEPLLNLMLEEARENLDGADLVSVMDDDLGVESFLEISPRDLQAKGKIRPVGARHFERRNQLVQNYQGMKQVIAQDPGVSNHISGVQEAIMLEDLLGLGRYDLVRTNVRIEEQAESAKLAQTLQQQLEEEAATPSDAEEAGAQEEALAQEGAPVDASQGPV